MNEMQKQSELQKHFFRKRRFIFCAEKFPAKEHTRIFNLILRYA